MRRHRPVRPNDVHHDTRLPVRVIERVPRASSVEPRGRRADADNEMRLGHDGSVPGEVRLWLSQLVALAMGAVRVVDNRRVDDDAHGRTEAAHLLVGLLVSANAVAVVELIESEHLNQTPERFPLRLGHASARPGETYREHLGNLTPSRSCTHCETPRACRSSSRRTTHAHPIPA